MSGPLHQFIVRPLLSWNVRGIDLSLTNSSLFMGIATFLTLVFFWGAIRSPSLIPGRLQYMGEKTFLFIQQLVLDHMGEKGMPYIPYMMSLFMFILMGNLLGMIPYGFTFTSQLIVTFSLAMMVFLGTFFVGILTHGGRYFRIFLPKEAPIYIIPFLIPIEILSYLTRPLSLAIRLLANMVAGHVMLKIFASFVVLLLGTSFFPLTLFPFFVTIAVIGFEFLVAFLQAYVFTVLTCLYLGDAIRLH